MELDRALYVESERGEKAAFRIREIYLSAKNRKKPLSPRNAFRVLIPLSLALMLVLSDGTIKMAQAYKPGFGHTPTIDWGNTNSDRVDENPEAAVDADNDSYYRVWGERRDTNILAANYISVSSMLTFGWRVFVSSFYVKALIRTEGDHWKHNEFTVIAHDGTRSTVINVTGITWDWTTVNPLFWLINDTFAINQPVTSIELVSRGEGVENYPHTTNVVTVEIKVYALQHNFYPTEPWYGVVSTDSSGSQKNVFYPSETVYVTGYGFPPPPTGTYNLFIVHDRDWTDEMLIQDIEKTVHINVNATGRIPVGTKAWEGPLTPGKYDIIVDVDGNGIYDEGLDAIDDQDIEVTAGFFVIPELFMGTIMGLAACVAALGVFRWSKRRHFNPKIPSPAS
ncbi:MAG: hypothetical protein ACE14S_10715 [Candidatus Bathyarchaeia archaeon]